MATACFACSARCGRALDLGNWSTSEVHSPEQTTMSPDLSHRKQRTYVLQPKRLSRSIKPLRNPPPVNTKSPRWLVPPGTPPTHASGRRSAQSETAHVPRPI